MFVVLGATGHIGGAVARALLKAQKPLTVVTRNAQKADLWRQNGAQAVVLDLLDTPALSALFQQAERAFVLNPPAAPDQNTDYVERQSVQAILAALKAASLQKVVVQSTYGAQQGEHCADLGVLFELEEGVRQLGTPASFIRAAYYMSNWCTAFEQARTTGQLLTFLPAEERFPMVAPEDVGLYAAHHLLAPVTETGTFSIEGPSFYTPADVARVMDQLAGRDIRVTTIPQSEWLAVYRQNGFSEQAAHSYATMTDIFVHKRYPLPVAPHKGGTSLARYLQAALAG
ncbi:MAG: NmrA family NAD(P)-binding protein [Acetobacter cibinongensis]